MRLQETARTVARRPRQERTTTKVLRFGYTPDPDDAYHYYALERSRIDPPDGSRALFVRAHVEELNRMARRGVLEVTAVSAITWPLVRDRYLILSSGSSVGRGYGPVLATRRGGRKLDLRGRRVAVPGLHTTGCFLLRLFYDDCELVEMPFDRVAQSVAGGEVDAGVLIHEELLRGPAGGLVARECLGERWASATGLPLPVGLVLGRRDLGRKLLDGIRGALHDSMAYALSHREDALAFARRFRRSPDEDMFLDYVDKFANADTLEMPDDVVLGLRELYARGMERGLLPEAPDLEIL